MATTTSAVATSFLTISRPRGEAGVERHAELVAVHRQEHRAAAIRPRADRDQAAILAAAKPLDADHLGAEVAEQRGAERAGDVAAEIEDADTVENTSHRSSPAKDAGA